MGARAGSSGHVAGPARVGAPAGTRPGGVARPTFSPVARSNRSVGSRNSHFVFSSNSHFGHNHFRNCFNGFPCSNRFFFSNAGLLYPYYPFFDPFYDNFYGNSDQPAPPQQAVESDNGNMELAMQVQRLSDQVEGMRDERRAAAARVQQQGSISAQPPSESTAFVFRDGHRITTQNYAIVGDTLWILNEHAAKKVPLADLDKAATEQVNSANGIDLRLP